MRRTLPQTNSSSMTSPITTTFLTAKADKSCSTRFLVSMAGDEQLVHGIVHLICGDVFDAPRRIRNQATIAWTGIALKWMLDNAVFNTPGTPTSGIGRTPNGDRRSTDRGGKMHRSRIVANV